MDDDALRRHNTESFWRSLRDCAWYAGQVAVMALAWHDKQRPLYLALAVVAAVIAVITGFGAATWRREMRRDRARSPR
jgi:hypothetical protein